MQREEIRALLFDIGGVVLDIDFGRAFRHWAQYSELSAGQIAGRFRVDEPYRRHETGECDASEYFAHLRDVLALRADDAEIAAGWNAIFVGARRETLERIARIRKQIPCYAFTNTNPTHQGTWMRAYPEIVASFDGIFSSVDLGLRKPDRAAYTTVTEHIGAPAPTILFLDDAAENVEGARAAGLRSTHCPAVESVHQALEEALAS